MSAAESSGRPTPSQERWLAVARRFRRQLRAPVGVERTGPWRGKGLPVRTALFVLGLLVGATVALILGLLDMPAAIVLAGIALVAVAEWLIWGRRLFNAGIEEGLWACGLGLVALDLSGVLHGGSERTLEWLLAGALAIAGVRLLNALLTTAAALLASVALYSAIGIRWPPVLPDWAPPSFVVSLLCHLGALAALAAGARHYRRPAHDRMLDGLVCTLPVAGYLWVGHSGWYASGIDYRHVHSLRELYVPAAPFLVALVALATGLRRRTHAPLLAAMACMACVAVELRASSGFGPETRLVVEGCVLLAACFALNRWLRSPRNGIGVQRPENDESTLDVIQQGGSLALGASHMKPVEPGFKGGGGTFGGGGASGHF
jgi:uncharacterized membrane protein YgcG